VSGTVVIESNGFTLPALAIALMLLSFGAGALVAVRRVSLVASARIPRRAADGTHERPRVDCRPCVTHVIQRTADRLVCR
jgi:hypothetical protein